MLILILMTETIRNNTSTHTHKDADPTYHYIPTVIGTAQRTEAIVSSSSSSSELFVSLSYRSINRINKTTNRSIIMNLLLSWLFYSEADRCITSRFLHTTTSESFSRYERFTIFRFLNKKTRTGMRTLSRCKATDMCVVGNVYS
jgi:hypothetical protein